MYILFYTGGSHSYGILPPVRDQLPSPAYMLGHVFRTSGILLLGAPRYWQPIRCPLPPPQEPTLSATSFLMAALQLQPLPPPGLSLLLSTVPITHGQASSVKHLFARGGLIAVEIRGYTGGREMAQQWSCGWASWAAPILKAIIKIWKEKNKQKKNKPKLKVKLK